MIYGRYRTMFLAGGITVFGFYGVLDWDEDLTNVSVCPQQLKKQQIGHWFLLSLRENNLDLLAVIFAGCIAPFVLPHLRRHGLAKAAKSMLSWYKQKQKSRLKRPHRHVSAHVSRGRWKQQRQSEGILSKT